MAERPAAGSRRELLWPLLFVIASTLLTATVYLSLLGAPLVILSSIAFGGVLDARRVERGLPLSPARPAAARRSVLVWGIPTAVCAVWGIGAVSVAIFDRLGADIDDDVLTGAAASGLLFAVPALVLSAPAFIASVNVARGRPVSSWPFVAGWALVVILFAAGVFCTAALFVDDRRPGLAAAGAAIVAWSVAAAHANASVGGRTGD